MKEEKLLDKDINIKNLAIGMMSYTSASILGPLIFFGLLGCFIDLYLDKKPIFLIIGVIMAFFTTNILIFKKVNKLSKKLNEYNEKEK